MSNRYPHLVANQFKKGQSGNPGGVHRRVREFLALARKSVPKALEYADRLLSDEDADARARLEAAKFICAYGIGPPPKVAEEWSDDDEPIEKLTTEELRALARRPLSSELAMTTPPAPGDTDPTKH